VLVRGLRRSCDFFDGWVGDVAALETSQLGGFWRLCGSVYFVEVIHCVALRTVKCLGYV
jgi:hypothetical protein